MKLFTTFILSTNWEKLECFKRIGIV